MKITKNYKIKKERKTGFMKNENVSVAQEGHQEARERYCVHVSRVQEIIFHFCVYVLFEILIVFIAKSIL